ncbi:FecR domain-containing protein [Desulfovibrio sp. JC022]|uniref:FecR domain-containing protein n=1 Tax=Desulfovibrio sp. JC022 TaxID=2593642 RepID=UPI00193EF52F|nr:FecR domain-containing protein [Desulfovibrio sp. JC022]
MPENALPEIGKIIAVNGEAFAESPTGLRPLETGSPVYEGEELVTGAGANLEVRFVDDTLLSQGEGSRISLDDYAFDSSGGSSDFFVDITQGTFRMVTGKIAEQNPERFKVGSPLATIGIRGTITLHEVLPGQGEKHGVEEIHSGKALLVQSIDGQLRQISQPQAIVDVSPTGALSTVRTLSTQEMTSFRDIAPASIRHEQEIRQEREEEEKEEDEVQDSEEETSEAEDENSEENAEGAEGEGAEGEGAEGEDQSGGSEGEAQSGGSEGAGPSGGSEGEGQTGGAQDEGRTGEQQGLPGDVEPGGGELNGNGVINAGNGVVSTSGKGALVNKDEVDGSRVKGEQEKIGDANKPENEGNDPNAQQAGEEGTGDEGGGDGEGSENADDILGDPLGQTGVTTGTAVPGTGTAPVQQTSTQTQPAEGDNDDEDDPPDQGDDGAGSSGEDESGDSGSQGSDENYIITGTEEADSLLGTAASEIIYGLGGNDTIDGGAGNDSVYGGSGNDRIMGGAGSNYIDGGEGSQDGISYQDSTQGIELSTSAGTVVHSGGTDSFVNVEGYIGSSSNDTLTGKDGEEYFQGGKGDDVIDGGVAPSSSGSSSRYSSGSNDDWDIASYEKADGSVQVDLSAGTATGADGNDTLSSIEEVIGSAYADILTGDAYDNFFQSNAGEDSIDGGNGYDTISYYAASGAVQVDISAGTATGADGSDTFTAIEGVEGSEYGDVLTGDDFSNEFRGRAGDDTIDGGDGNDTVDYKHASAGVYVNLAAGTATGGDGNDRLISIENVEASQNYNDTIIGNDGENRFKDRGQTDDTYDGGQGSDSLTYHQADSGVVVDLAEGTSSGGGGNDSISNIWNIDGSDYGDTLIGGTGDGSAYSVCNLSGGEGDDFIVGGSAHYNHLDGDDGNDTLTAGDGQNAYLNGGSGNDTLTATGGHVQMIGGAGQDTFVSGSGQDVYSYSMPSDGDDTVIGFDSSADKFNFISDNFSATAEFRTVSSAYDGSNGGIGSSYSAFIFDAVNRQLWFDSNGDDAGGNTLIATLDGTDLVQQENILINNSPLVVPGPTTQTGTAGNDNIVGNSDSNTIYGLAGNDALFGNAGADVIEGGADHDSIEGGDGDDDLDGGDGHDNLVYVNAESGVNVNLADGTVTGGAGNDTIANFEVIYGSAHDDSLIGNDEYNQIMGNDGDDYLDGRGGWDMLEYYHSTSGVNVDLVAGTVTGGSGNDTVLNFEHVVGSEHADTIAGNDENNTLEGKGGDDSLSGGGGDDRIYGGAGDDRIDGGDGNDFYDHGFTSSGAEIDLAAGTVSSDEGEDTLISIENAYGSSEGDTITGSAERNMIYGQDGDDTIIGGAGADMLDGGLGNDVFVYDTLESSTVTIEQIVNFSSTDDSLDFDGSKYSSSSAYVNYTGGGNYNGESAGLGAGTAFVYDSNNLLWYDDNGDASGGLHFITEVIGLTESNITVDGVALNPSGVTQSGTSGDDSLIGTMFADTLSGLGGNDLLNGYGGDDSLDGGAGNDTLYGGSGDDIISASSNTNHFYGGTGADTMTGGSYIDYFYLNSGDVEAGEAIDGGGTDYVQVDSSTDASAGEAWLNIERVNLGQNVTLTVNQAQLAALQEVIGNYSGTESISVTNTSGSDTFDLSGYVQGNNMDAFSVYGDDGADSFIGSVGQ